MQEKGDADFVTYQGVVLECRDAANVAPPNALGALPGAVGHKPVPIGVDLPMIRVSVHS